MDYSRKESLKKVAYDISLYFSEKDDRNILPYLKGFKLFRRGGRKRITNVLFEEHPMLEYRVYIFDYKYTINTNNSSKTYKQTVFFVQSKKLALPSFWMKPESFFHKVGELLKLTKDIDFVDYPEFSKQYKLKSEDEDYTRATMNDQILHFFTINKNWSLEGANYYMIFYQHNKIIKPPRIKDFYKKGLHLKRLFKFEDIGL